MKVLVVDDDEMVRTVCSGMLNLLQHEVVAVSSGEAAIKTLQTVESPFDLIVLDEIMPGMSGLQMMERMSYLGMTTPVILCSGREMTVEEFTGTEGVRPNATLGKPFTMQRLQAAIETAFSDRR